MSDDYAEFMPGVMEYAVDSASESPLRLAGREVGRINPTTFVEQLYIPWRDDPFEETLYECMIAATQLTCITAFRGCGKTSALWHAAARVSHEHLGKIIPVILDIKQMYDNGAFSPLTDKPDDEALRRAFHIFKTEIRKVVQLRLLPGSTTTIKLLAWALAGPPDHSDWFSDWLVAGLIDLSDRAVTAAHAGSKTRRERLTAIAHFLESPARFLEFHAAAMEHITAAHVVRACMTVRGVERVVLIFDNIDRIPMSYQVKFMEAVNDTHNALGGMCGTVVAIRRETLRRQPARANEKGDPIDIIAPNSAEYPPVLFPDTKADHVRAILQRRHDYSLALYQDHEADAPTIARIVALHSCVADEFVRDSIHALANGSIRALAKIYTGFFRYIHRAESANITRSQDVRTDEGHLQTLFFLFLRENAREYGLIYYEIVRRDGDPATASDVPDLASPHHLLLTALLNLTNELRETSGGEHDVTFRELVERVTTLGFSLETIRAALIEMHADFGEPPRTIEFLDVEPDIAALDKASTCRMRLTPLGQVLVTSLLHKVGYVWGQAHDSFRRATGNRDGAKSYYDLEQMERVRIFFSYVRELALSHLKMLALVKARLFQRYAGAWLATYRAQFGVGGQFQVQRLCASAAAFYQPHFTKNQGNPFITLRRIYEELLDEILRNPELKELRLNRLTKRMEDYYRPGDRIATRGDH